MNNCRQVNNKKIIIIFFKNNKGDILVFLTGEKEIKEFKIKLE